MKMIHLLCITKYFCTKSSFDFCLGCKKATWLLFLSSTKIFNRHLYQADRILPIRKYLLLCITAIEHNRAISITSLISVGYQDSEILSATKCIFNNKTKISIGTSVIEC